VFYQRLKRGSSPVIESVLAVKVTGVLSEEDILS
jgi:hypothetical protein